MKKIVLLFLFCILVTSLFARTDKVISQQLQEKIQSSERNEFIRINLIMNDKYNSQELINETQFLDKGEKRQHVKEVLKDFSRTTQKNLLQELRTYENNDFVRNINSLWIANVINCYANSYAIEQLSKRTDIKLIDWDETRQVLINDKKNNRKISYSNPVTREITWNVTQVGADDVWNLGYTGAGVIVAVIDTGVRYTHNDLSDHVWDGSGAGYPLHGYDFYNNDNDPMDGDGHGTHCAGTVAGDGTSGSQTGMAPDATIMCLKVLSDTGAGTESGVWSAIEFAVNHGADVISMSLGWQHSWGPTRETWRDAMDDALAAGVIAAVAAGNEGDEQGTYPIPDNVRTPGDAPPPWLHPDQTLIGGISAVVCVGATDSSDNIASFSGRGPSTWTGITGYNDYAYNPGMGLTRPDISAPGVNIKSLSNGSDTGYADGWNGTSMATPCVAGVIALMIQKNPNITPAHISQYLEENVDIEQTPKNNTYGSGRINALSSVIVVPASGNPLCNITNPSQNEVIEKGTIETITVSASDPSRSVSNVKIYIDNDLKVTDTTSPYEYIWDTGSETLDYHTIKAVAIDNDLNETIDEITVRVASPTINIFEDDFETDKGWTLSGEFERAAPGGLGGEHGNPDPTSAYAGSNVLGVDLSGTGTYSGDYEVSLADDAYKAITPEIDCTNYSNVTLSFYRWLNVEQPTYDHANIDVTTDGSIWTNIWTNSSGIEESSWGQQNIDISTYADGEATVQIRFCIGTTDGSYQYSGWNIDNLIISGESAAIPGQGQGDNLGDPTQPALVDVEPIDIDGSSVDPDVIVDPTGDLGITVNITVTDAVQGSTPVPNPDNVIISYAVEVIGTISGVNLAFDLEFTGLTGLDQIHWLDGTNWLVPNNVSWSTPDHVTFDLTLTDRDASTEIILSRDDPLPVSLSSFTAIYSDGSPIVNWVTQSESDNIGWNVYRAVSFNFGQAQILNLNTIPGNGTTSQPSFYSFTDEYEVQENSTYWYWLESISGSGETESFGPVSLTITSDGNEIPEIPLETALHQNFPNPFNPSTLISFEIKENETGVLSIYNVKGQLIVKEEFGEGRHTYPWDARDHSSGIYLYKLQAKRYSKIMKMLLVK